MVGLQECNFFSIASYGETEYYCSDSCDDPSQCADEGTCELTYELCEDFTRPCPATASCAPPAALPASLCATCGDYQASQTCFPTHDRVRHDMLSGTDGMIAQALV